MALPLLFKKLLIRSRLVHFMPGLGRHYAGGGPFFRYLSDRMLAAPVEDLQDAAGFLELAGPDAIDLGLGAPRHDLAPSGSTKLPVDRRGWPPVSGLPDLRAAIAIELHTSQQLQVNPVDEILVTHGATGAYSTVLDAFVNPRARVVLFDPSSPLYSFALRARRARLRWVPTWMEDGRTRFHFKDLSRALRGARLLILNSPANPTGGVIAPEDMEQIAWWADRRDVLIFNDCVYHRYASEGPGVNIAALASARERTLTAGSLSKTHGLASARVGWLAGCRPLIQPCLLSMAVHTPFVPTLSQQVGLAALRQGSQPLALSQAEFDSRRRYAFERLRGMDLRAGWPAGAFFFWIPVWELGLSGTAFAERLRREWKVLVTPGNHFGPSGRGYIRLSYAIEDGRLRAGLGRLAEFLRGGNSARAAGAKHAA